MKYNVKLLSFALSLLLFISLFCGCDLTNAEKETDATQQETQDYISTEQDIESEKTSDSPVVEETAPEIESSDSDSITKETTELDSEDNTDKNDGTTTEEETDTSDICDKHTDQNDDGECDVCNVSLIISIDFYALNDLHGKFKDTDSNSGVDELTAYLKSTLNTDDNSVFLSSGDMWQGSSESNLTNGFIITEWMNELDFVSMTLGNHEYDWGEEIIEDNCELAEFPLLAINIYDRETNQRADYCESSVIVECNGIQVGIIGAIGDCYSSISADKSGDVYFKVGNDLTALVKAESERLRSIGVDFIVYSIHDGFGQNKYSPTRVSSAQLASYYDTELSNGYVDLVFEGHTHQRYVLIDEYGVYHLQNGGENKGISHVEIAINSVTFTSFVGVAEFVESSRYSGFDGDPLRDQLLEKYKDQIAKGDEVLGTISSAKYSSQIKATVAQLYYQRGIELFGDQYDIVLGGGFISTRSPYDLDAGQVKYSDLQSLLPFDNQLVLCSIKGSDLKKKFLETSNSNYYIYCGEYGESIKNNIDPNATYYLITDTYTSTYSYNRLTEIVRFDDGVYARDLLAEFIKNGGWK